MQDNPPAPQITPSPSEQALAAPVGRPKKSRETLSTVLLFAGALLTAILLNVFVFQSYEVDGQSMEPTLQSRDRLIIYKLNKTWSKISRSDYMPERGDIIVFHKPNGSSDQLIKRVVGLPGDRVVVKNEVVTIFNEQNPNGYSPDDAPYGDELLPTYGNVDVTVEKDEVFVMGDNRIAGASLDSRSSLGNIPTKYIVGELVLRYLPIGNYRGF
jgi:signal peptidase I